MAGYWERRALEREDAWQRKSRETIEKELAAYYVSSLEKIQSDMALLYARFAVDNSLSISAARKLLTGSEFREWRMGMEAYLSEIHRLSEAGEVAKSQGLLRELNTLTMRSRISRLDKLRSETMRELDRLGRKQEGRMDKFLSDAYKDNYYRGLFEIGKEAGAKSSYAKLDPVKMEAVLRTPWSGKNYSQIIWKDMRELERTLQYIALHGTQRGASVQKLVGEVAERMGVARTNAERLIRTELNYIQNRAALDSIKESGMEFYRIIATHDARTCPRCGGKDGIHVAADHADPGDTLPPFHARCRCTIAASFGEDVPQKGRRIARDASGKNTHIPADMKYADWKAVYIDKTRTLASWEEEHAKKVAAAVNIASQAAVCSGIIENKQGWKKISNEHSPSQDLQEVNPNYTTGEYRWKNNCQRCVPTYELRRRGYDVTAKPLPSNDPEEQKNDYLSQGNHYFHMFKNAKIIRCGGQGIKDVNRLMKQWGNGARAEIQFVWKGGASGHVFVAENRNGHIVFIDPQSCTEGVDYLKSARNGYTTIHRIDNLEFTDYIYECCKGVAR